jgi:hypothetical protein
MNRNQPDQENIEKGKEAVDKIGKVIGEQSRCIKGQGGFSCMNDEDGKIFQVGRSGVSVSKVNINVPESSDYMDGNIKVKELDENCKIGTVTDQNGNEISQGLCATSNSDPLQAGDNLDAMNKKTDEYFG